MIGWYQRLIWVKLMLALSEDEHMKELADEAFPHARAFKRAGFDEPLPPPGQQSGDDT